MIVRFYKLTDAGEVIIGEMRLEDGQIVLDPPEQPELMALIKDPEEEVDPQTGERIVYDPKTEPQAFLESCLRLFHGSYFWCKKVLAPTGTESAEHHRDT